jgi:hypothetical protein
VSRCDGVADGSFRGLLRLVSRWSIGRVRSVPPQPGSDRDAAFAIHFAEDDQSEPQMTVEYAKPSKHASATHAREAVRPYLDDESPPRRLIVDREGNARLGDA